MPFSLANGIKCNSRNPSPIPWWGAFTLSSKSKTMKRPTERWKKYAKLLVKSKGGMSLHGSISQLTVLNSSKAVDYSLSKGLKRGWWERRSGKERKLLLLESSLHREKKKKLAMSSGMRECPREMEKEAECLVSGFIDTDGQDRACTNLNGITYGMQSLLQVSENFLSFYHHPR